MKLSSLKLPAALALKWEPQLDHSRPVPRSAGLEGPLKVPRQHHNAGVD